MWFFNKQTKKVNRKTVIKNGPNKRVRYGLCVRSRNLEVSVESENINRQKFLNTKKD